MIHELPLSESKEPALIHYDYFAPNPGRRFSVGACPEEPPVPAHVVIKSVTYKGKDVTDFFLAYLTTDEHDELIDKLINLNR